VVPLEKPGGEAMKNGVVTPARSRDDVENRCVGNTARTGADAERKGEIKAAVVASCAQTFMGACECDDESCWD
jgi:hypothetical protein